ncbi:hypothetical protein NIM87_18115 [Devosia sp. XJ19-1]|uniref:Uncharacterized protein n=1 Tax=Devosia ureilytica TaxID=2952754 RepID=A0A9Q4AR41_9HYPH|nr:hypothetical protein [Devosia ureilytica]MCP8885425.1 hypothetical protein [Devosia ureilytica]MCP8888108.1 hypothetical protein [Devosia ureilytica]
MLDAAAPRKADMSFIPPHGSADQANMVHDIEVVVGNRRVKAHYNIENGIVWAKAADKTYRCPVEATSAAETVKAMLRDMAATAYFLRHA